MLGWLGVLLLLLLLGLLLLLLLLLGLLLLLLPLLLWLWLGVEIVVVEGCEDKVCGKGVDAGGGKDDGFAWGRDVALDGHACDL